MFLKRGIPILYAISLPLGLHSLNLPVEFDSNTKKLNDEFGRSEKFTRAY